MVFSIVALASCLGAISVADLPPGDWYEPTIVNDTAHSIIVRHCTDERCSVANQETVAVIAAGSRQAIHQASAHGGDVFAIGNGAQQLGCLAAPGEATGDVGHVELRVSQAGRCRPSYPPTPRWLIPDLVLFLVSVLVTAGVGIQQVRMNRRARAASAP